MSPVAMFWFGMIAAIVYLPFSENPPSSGRSIAKTVPVASLAVAAWLADAPLLLALALLLSALGNFALSRGGMRAFLVGFAAFAGAHVVYLVLFTALSARGPYMAFVDHTLLALFLAWVAISAEIWLVPHAGPGLKWPIRTYVLILTLMALSALTLPLGAVAIGAVYVVGADVILAYRNFRMAPDDPLSGRAGWLMWILYVAGQGMILVGVVDLISA